MPGDLERIEYLLVEIISTIVQNDYLDGYQSASDDEDGDVGLESDEDEDGFQIHIPV
jgi:hypothetical protein